MILALWRGQQNTLLSNFQLIQLGQSIMGPQRPISRMRAGRSFYHWIQNINSSFITRISLRNTHFRGALIGLSFSITIGGLVSPCQQLQFHQQLKSVYQLQMQKKKKKTQSRRVESEKEGGRSLEWDKRVLIVLEKRKKSLSFKLTISLSLSTHAT